MREGKRKRSKEGMDKQKEREGETSCYIIEAKKNTYTSLHFKIRYKKNTRSLVSHFSFSPARAQKTRCFVPRP